MLCRPEADVFRSLATIFGLGGTRVNGMSLHGSLLAYFDIICRIYRRNLQSPDTME